MRVGALQDWPVLRKHDCTPSLTALLKIGILQNDVRRLAAEFLRDPLHASEPPP